MFILHLLFLPLLGELHFDQVTTGEKKINNERKISGTKRRERNVKIMTPIGSIQEVIEGGWSCFSVSYIFGLGSHDVGCYAIKFFSENLTKNSYFARII